MEYRIDHELDCIGKYVLFVVFSVLGLILVFKSEIIGRNNFCFSKIFTKIMFDRKEVKKQP